MSVYRPPAIFISGSLGLDFLNTLATPVDKPVDWIEDGDGLLSWLEQAQLVPAKAMKAVNYNVSDPLLILRRSGGHHAEARSISLESSQNHGKSPRPRTGGGLLWREARGISPAAARRRRASRDGSARTCATGPARRGRGVPRPRRRAPPAPGAASPCAGRSRAPGACCA